MDQVEAMRIFVRVAELSSFTQAAERMGMTKASVSSAITQLESRLRTRLFFRTTRKVELTQDGRAYLERCQDLLADFDEAESMFQRGPADIAGRLRVDMSSGVARNIVVPRLPEFLRAYPKIELELSSTDRRVDVIREGFDCVMRVGAVVDLSLIARPLGRFRILNYVSAAYAKQYGIPQSIADLRDHHLVHYVSTLGAKSTGFEYMSAQGEVFCVEMQGCITVNNADAYQAACLAGFGIIQAPEVGVGRLIQSGDLIEVLHAFRAEPMPVSLLYANRRYLPKRVQTFMAWIADVMKPHLIAD